MDFPGKNTGACFLFFLRNLPDLGIEPGSPAWHRGVASGDRLPLLACISQEKNVIKKSLLLSLAHFPCLPHFKEGNMRGNGEGAFHLLEAQAGLGSEGQETDFTCCSASDLRGSHIQGAHTAQKLLLPSNPAPGPGSLLGQGG